MGCSSKNRPSRQGEASGSPFSVADRTECEARSLLVVTDPEVTVDRASVRDWCASGPLGGANLEPLAADIDVVSPETTDEVISLVAKRPVQAPLVVVTKPGDADAVLARLPRPAERKIVWLEMEAASTRRTDARPLIRGRGVNGYHWAVRTAHWRWQIPFVTISYGPQPENVGELRLPEGDGPFPVVVVMHGGYYREQWERDTSEPTAIGLTNRGFATWNIEYRRTGPGGDGGWPDTFEDVATAIDYVAVLAKDYPLDLDRVVFLGHSAGGHLALWGAARPNLPADAPGGGRPALAPALVVSLAGVVDLVVAAERGVGFGHNPITALMRATPAEMPFRYASASPSELYIEAPQLLIQGVSGDDPDLIDINRRYAVQHPDVTYVEIERANHFDLTYPYSDAWKRVVAELEKKLYKCVACRK